MLNKLAKYQVRKKVKGDHVYLRIEDSMLYIRRVLALIIIAVIVTTGVFIKGGIEQAYADEQKAYAYEVQQTKSEQAREAKRQADIEAEQAREAAKREAEVQAYLAEQARKVEAEKLIQTKIVKETPTYSNSTNCNLKSAGVVYFGGLRFTYYSSRVLYHYRTPEWHTNASGMYCDAAGYLVCARSDVPMGTITETPWGTAKVYDCGCADGTVDMYVCW